MKFNLAKTSLIVYLAMLIFAGFLPSPAGGRVVVFCIMGVFAIPPIIIGTKNYRILGTIALIIAVTAALIDFQAGKRSLDDLKEVLSKNKEQTSQN